MAIGSQGEVDRSSGRTNINTSKVKMRKRSKKMVRPSRAGAGWLEMAFSSEAGAGNDGSGISHSKPDEF
jgi:hypothetical protein